MTLREAAEILEAEVIVGEQDLDRTFESCGASDLMSDILAFAHAGILLLTGLATTQSVRTAKIIEAEAVVYVRGKRPGRQGIELAEQVGLPILTTRLPMYTACCRLCSRGVTGVGSR